MDSVVIARDGAVLSAPITFELVAGEMLAIQGSNGSGKSTLLRTLAGLLPAHSGAVRVNELSPTHMRPLYFGHKNGLSPSMSVLDNVSFWAKAAGYPELVGAALRYFDLDDIPGAIVNELSAGWQQRVALTRLITMPNTLWLLDEPTANLDAEGVALLQSLMQSRLEQGGIIVVATHFQMQGGNLKILNLSPVAPIEKGVAA
ncbi:MAG: heme ABC exporter ATP-binding protein CcmA [Rickettsiales bacterium]